MHIDKARVGFFWLISCYFGSVPETSWMAISWRICKHTSASLYPYNIYSFCFLEPSLLCRFSSELPEHFFGHDIMAVAVQVLREFSLGIPSLTVSIYLQMHNHCAFVNIIDQTNSSIIAFERCRWFCCDWALCDVNADWFSRDGMFGTALVDPPHTSLASCWICLWAVWC